MYYKILILILIAGFAGLFFLNGPGGKPIMTLGDLTPTMPDISITESEPVSVYKWKDANGVWQFSDQPVETEAEDVEVMVLDGKINTMTALKIPDEEDVGALRFKIPAGLTTVAPDKVSKMMDAVNSLQDTVDQRAENIRKMEKGSD